MKDKQSC